MEQLKRAIEDAAIMAKEPVGESSRLYPELQQAAETWATHSLRCYHGESLRRALAVSQSLVDFVEEISKGV